MNESFENKNFINLTLIISVLTLLVNGLDIYAQNGLVTFDFNKLLELKLIDLIFFPFRIAPSWLSLFIFVIINYSIGVQVERSMGSPVYSLYFFCNFLFVILGLYFYDLNASYIYFPNLFALAWRLPKTEVLLFFIISVKLVYVALIFYVFLCYPIIHEAIIRNSFSPIIALVLINLSFLIFHFKEFIIKFKEFRKKK